jgi:type IV pilus assembly protein PilY1
MKTARRFAGCKGTTGLAALLLSCLLVSAPSRAATSISDYPMVLNISAAPNVLMILDNSGSMNWEGLPDYLSDGDGFSFTNSVPTSSGTSTYMPDYSDTNIFNVAMRSSQINKVYYNPKVTYRRWTDGDGIQYADSPPAAAPRAPGSRFTTDLTAQQTMSFIWVSNTATTFAPTRSATPRTEICAGPNRYCSKTFWPMTFFVYKGIGSQFDRSSYVRYRITNAGATMLDLNGGVETAVTSFSWTEGSNTIARTIEQERQNFANWFTYSRSRTLAAKNGISAAFSSLGYNYRVGFRPLNGVTGILDIPITGEFSGTNRQRWFSNMLGSTSGGGTPLRAALASAGEYYSTDAPWEDADGGYLACRQSFTILTTDGYYNDSQRDVEDVNPDIGNADGDQGAPYADTRSWTLADVAMHYYKTDLRPYADKVPTSDLDPASYQHMVTFGVAFGLQGSLDPAVDLPRLTSGEISWPSTSSDLGKQDDLWHATVNGRGQFVSATTPEEFAAGLKGALDSIVQRTASSSNLGVSTSELQEGSNVFQARFTSEVWTGDIWAYPVTDTGVSTTPTWKAATKLAEMTPASRNIYTRSGSNGVTFEWANLSATQKSQLGDDSAVLDYLRGDQSREVSNGGSFRNRLAVLGDIIHSSPVFVGAAENFSYERFPWAGASSYQSHRSAVAERGKVVYVAANDGMLHAFAAGTGAEKFAYVPSAALPAMFGLKSTLYSHRFINDGALVVGDVYRDASGSEAGWRTVLVGSLGRGGRQVYALDVTDSDEFGGDNILWEFTDADMGKFIGRPVIARLSSGRWAVLMGNGYNSDNQHAYLFVIDALTGALIRKIDTGACPSSDTVCASGGNGMADATIWDEDGDGDVDYVYGGDLRGNVWRFDIGSETASEWKVSFGTADSPLPLYQAKDASGKPQPITSKIEVLQNPKDGVRWITFGSGKFLANADRDDDGVQTWYGLYDNYLGSTTSPVSGRDNLASRVILYETPTYLEGTTDINPDRVRVVSAPGDTEGGAAMTDANGNYVKRGWYLDLVPPPAAGAEASVPAGERIIYGVQVFNRALFATTAVPGEDSCTPGGNGWLLAVDPYTGGRLTENLFIDVPKVSVSVGDGVTVTYNVSGIGFTSIPSSPILARRETASNGNGGEGNEGGGNEGGGNEGGGNTGEAVISQADGSIATKRLGLFDNAGRLSWRELIND